MLVIDVDQKVAHINTKGCSVLGYEKEEIMELSKVFVDLPKDKRKRTDKTLTTRIHKVAKLRLGGLAVMIPFLLYQVILL